MCLCVHVSIHVFIFPVFEILLAFSQNKDWKKSFYEVIPPRKVASADSKSDETDIQLVADDEELDGQPTSPQSTSNQSHSVNCNPNESEVDVDPDCPVEVVEVVEADKESSVVGNSRDESTLHESRDDSMSEVSTTVG